MQVSEQFPTITSESHPIRVDFLPQNVTGMPGQLGVTLAPGKRNIGMQALWQRDLESDLARLRQHYGTELLITLLEPHELDELQVPQLFERVEAHAMETHAFPIQDFGTPSSMPQFIELVMYVLENLRRGKAIVVHCKAGLGRSGLVAASCLVALGFAPEEAFTQLRAIRPGSVETPDQEAFVAEFARICSSVRSESLLE